MKRLFLLTASAVVALVGLATVLAARYVSPQLTVPLARKVPVPDGAPERLAGAIRIRTISTDDQAAFNGAVFQEMHTYLQNMFPKVHAQLQREVIGDHSLLYRWDGTDASLEPVMLIGHLDVVPIEAESESRWRYDPFGGLIAEGWVWGRGAIDNKSAVLGTLEAVEMLLTEGFRPARTIYLAYGHDEEVGGARGARQIAGLLKQRGITLDTVLDEGGVIGADILRGVPEAVALVGVAEKGFLSVELSTQVTGGHSSLPPAQTAVGIVSAAVARLEKHPMPARFEPATSLLFDRIGPHLRPLQRTMVANRWLTHRFLLSRLEQAPQTNAMIRTTTAPTMFHAGTKDNVLPSSARAVVNFRILTGDSIEAVVGHIRRVIEDDRVTIKNVGRFSAEPSSTSSSESESFRKLERTIRSVAPDVIVAPYLVVVVTDARHYSDISRNVYRFLPLRLTSEDLARMHGIDEGVPIEAYETAIRMYRQFLIQASFG